jgi:hypothetical protein
VFFKDAASVAPVVIASGSASWGSISQLQSVTLLQQSIAGETKNFVLGTSNQGTILAVDAVGGSSAFQAFNIVTERATSPSFPASQCDSSPQQYGLRASSKSGRVYLTDRNFCQALALEIVSARRPVSIAERAGERRRPDVLHDHRLSARRCHDCAGHRP